MYEIADYLLKNYYPKYTGNRKEIIPERELLVKALKIYKDKVIVIRKDGIEGVGIYLTLNDETYSNIDKFDITEIAILSELLQEKGDNVHFILVAGSRVENMLLGINIVKKRERPKTISWWNPSMTKLHKYNLKKEI